MPAAPCDLAIGGAPTWQGVYRKCGGVPRLKAFLRGGTGSQRPIGAHASDLPYGAVQAVRRGLTPRRAVDDTNLHSPGGGT